MIEFYSENDFILSDTEKTKSWIDTVIKAEGFETGEIYFIFCNDEYLLKINQEFLSHNTYTDIISFDYSLGKQLSGEIYISTERVKDNSREFDVDFITELNRVIIHGVLHYCGHKDATEEDKLEMRSLEDKYLEMYRG